MKTNVLSEYSKLPYILIGLEFTDHHALTLFNSKNSNEIKHIFGSINHCENFITEQKANAKIVVIISSYFLGDELIKLQSYPQVDTIYSYIKSNDDNEEFICVYKKVKDREYSEIFIGLLGNLWFLIGLIIVAILAYLFPQVGASDGPLYAKYTVKWGCVFIIFLLSSLSLSIKDLANDLFNYRLHLSVQIYSLIFIPCIVIGIALLLAMTSINQILIIGVIIMSCMPTANSINIITTKYAGGNESATLLNVLFGGILGIFISPITIAFFMTISRLAAVQQSYNIRNYTGVIGMLGITALLPIIIGQIISYIWTEKMMWAKTKFYFAELNTIALLIMIWTVLSDLFQSGLLKTVYTSDLLIIILLNAVLFIVFTLLALFLARLPNIFVCRKRTINSDHQPLIPEHQSKSPTLIERWRFSRENTITFMFCGSTKALSLGIPIITAVYTNYSSGFIGLLAVPLILYDVEQMIICSIEIILLQRFFK